jgi:hypothetical protein
MYKKIILFLFPAILFLFSCQVQSANEGRSQSRRTEFIVVEADSNVPAVQNSNSITVPQTQIDPEKIMSPKISSVFKFFRPNPFGNGEED